MWDKIVAFFMAIFAFFSSLFGGGGSTPNAKTFVKNVKYGSETRQVVDIAYPENATGDIGLVLMIHGGAWIYGDKETYTDSIKYGATLGFVCAAMNYRYISEKTNINDIMDDVTACLATIKAQAAERGLNVTKVLLTGTSAGAHLSLLYAYSRKAEAPIAPAAVVSYCGPTDLADWDDAHIYNNPMGDTSFMSTLLSYACGMPVSLGDYKNEEVQKALKKVSPLYYVDKNTVPTVICHGDKDTIVPFSDSVKLNAALTANNVTHRYIVYRNSDHDLAADKEAAKIGGDLLIEYANTYLR